MYESPINLIYGEMQTQIEGDIYKVVQNVGIDVNKEELLKALQYDRRQYNKGYADGNNEALKDVKNYLHYLEHDNGDGTNVTLTPRDIDNIAEEMRKGGK